MVKLSARFAGSILLLILAGLAGPGSVSAAPGPAPGPATTPTAMLEHPMTFTLSASPTEVRKLWTQQITGLMTDLAVSRDGSAILLATIPNPDGGDGPRESGHGLTRYNRAGKKLWHIELEGTVKSLALSDDGKLALVSTYDNTISAIDPRGRIVWTVEGICKPIPIGKRFLCYHDDDAEPGVAFDVYTDKGRKVLYYPITRDILALKVSDDERNTAIALEGGQVILFGPDFRSLWQRKVAGEVLDLAVSSGEHPRVAALFNSAGTGTAAAAGAGTRDRSKPAAQAIAVFDDDGKRLGEAVPGERVEQLEAAPSGRGIAAYGNGAQGQYVAFYELPLLSTRVVDPRSADFSSNMIMTRDLVILGFEDIGETARHSHLIAFDLDGGLKWNLPLVTEEGAYLYAHGFAPIPSLISVGTDDGYLSAFQLKAAASPPPRTQADRGAGLR
jgi:outer membrane protein assembly factor BamB